MSEIILSNKNTCHLKQEQTRKLEVINKAKEVILVTSYDSFTVAAQYLTIKQVRKYFESYRTFP